MFVEKSARCRNTAGCSEHRSRRPPPAIPREAACTAAGRPRQACQMPWPSGRPCRRGSTACPSFSPPRKAAPPLCGHTEKSAGILRFRRISSKPRTNAAHLHPTGMPDGAAHRDRSLCALFDSGGLEAAWLTVRSMKQVPHGRIQLPLQLFNPAQIPLPVFCMDFF